MRAAALILATTLVASSPATAQTSAGDFTGQPTFGTTIRPYYPFCQVDAPGKPRVVTSGICGASQLSQGGVNFTANYDSATQTNPSVTQDQFPASASQGVGVTASGTYNDPRFPGASYSTVTTTLPLSDFATSASVSSTNAALAAETNRAITAEAVLGRAIVNESNAREADVARLSSQFKVATATAVALGGNGFIPGKRLNLTVNYGAYEGKSAMAFQGGFVVNTNAYVNVGVASGLNGGGTAFRTGLTMGW